jgi:NAD+ kinase
VKRVGILYHPRIEKARELAIKLRDLLVAEGVSSWQCSAWDEDKAKTQIDGSDLVFSIGGDGTILHAAHVSAPFTVPILGVNLGKVGFITEVGADELLLNLSNLLKVGGWIEERIMLEAQIEDKSLHALNDIVLRTTTVRLINIEVKVDDELLATYRADGVIVATATGSTAYSLAAGGPILHPQSREIVVQPISCHLGLTHALVLPSQSGIALKVANKDKAILSVDGQFNLPLRNEQNVTVKLSPYSARFLRIGKQTYFYSSLRYKLRNKEVL